MLLSTALLLDGGPCYTDEHSSKEHTDGLTMRGVDSGIVGVGHQKSKLGADVPIGVLLFLGLGGIQVDRNLVKNVVSLREKQNAPIRSQEKTTMGNTVRCYTANSEP